MANETESTKQTKKSSRIAHPVAFVVFVPVDVDIDVENMPGIEWTEGASSRVPVVVDTEKAADSIEKISDAVAKSNDVGTVLDEMLYAAYGIQQKIPGVEVNFTAWYGLSEFQEVK